jgi:hypothetical protein
MLWRGREMIEKKGKVVLTSRAVVALVELVGRDRLGEMIDEFERLGKADIPEYSSVEVKNLHVQEDIHYRLRKLRIEKEYRTFDDLLRDIVFSYCVRRVGKDVLARVLMLAPGGVLYGKG